MKLKINKNILPVLGWCDMSVSSCYKILEKDMQNGEVIIYNTARDFEDTALCAFIFYDDYHNKNLYSVFTGKIEFIGLHTDLSAPFTYKFYPMKEAIIKAVGYCKNCGEPGEVMLEDKKL